MIGRGSGAAQKNSIEAIRIHVEHHGPQSVQGDKHRGMIERAAVNLT